MAARTLGTRNSSEFKLVCLMEKVLSCAEKLKLIYADIPL